MEIKMRPDEIKKTVFLFFKKRPVISALAVMCAFLMLIFLWPSRPARSKFAAAGPVQVIRQDSAVYRAVSGMNGMEGIAGKSVPESPAEAPPELESVKLMPGTFHPGDYLFVNATAPGADQLVYEWSVNGNYAGNSGRLETPIKRGDLIRVKITPCKDNKCGQSVVLERTVGNMPPMFSRGIEASFDGSLYTCRVHASDPDNDPLTYSLADAPNGMSIGPETGVITWKASAEQLRAGHEVTVVASDGHGGTSRMTFTIRPE